jgi:hypothetical protein
LQDSADKSALRTNGIDKQAPFLELLAGLIEGLSDLYLRENVPVCVSDFADKISHEASLPHSQGCKKHGAFSVARKVTQGMLRLDE